MMMERPEQKGDCIVNFRFFLNFGRKMYSNDFDFLGFLKEFCYSKIIFLNRFRIGSRSRV